VVVLSHALDAIEEVIQLDVGQLQGVTIQSQVFVQADGQLRLRRSELLP
jgi:hypothetical protein